jgi:hypothetical protein
MFVVTLRVKPRDTEELTKRIQASLTPILKRNPGFRGYHSIQSDEGERMGVFMFETRDDAEAFRDQSQAFVDDELVPLAGQPEIFAGEVLYSIRPEGMGAQPGAGTGAEARPH